MDPNIDFAAAMQNPRIGQTLEELKAWIASLDESDVQCLARPAHAFMPLAEAFPAATSDRERLVNWLSVADNKGWDQNWGNMAYRVHVFVLLMEQGFDRTFAPGGTVASPALRAKWEALRAGKLSDKWLAGGLVSEMIPLSDEYMPLRAVLKAAPGAPASSGPVPHLAAWLGTMSDHALLHILMRFRMLRSEAQMAVGGPTAERLQVIEWLGGAGRPEGVSVRYAVFNRIVWLVRTVEEIMRSQFSGIAFDHLEKQGLQLKNGEISIGEMFPMPLPAEQLEELKKHMLSELEQYPARRSEMKMLGEGWDKIVATELTEDGLRAWAASA